jgi:hypothetical protein
MAAMILPQIPKICVNLRSSPISWDAVISLKPKQTTTIQYVSNLNLDAGNRGIPSIYAHSDYLAICGGLGKPTHPNFRKFFRSVSDKYKGVFFVPGNREYDCGHLYQTRKFEQYDPMIREICSQFNNVYYLNRNAHHLEGQITVLGATLWSDIREDPQTQICHDERHQESYDQHRKDVGWLKNAIKTYHSRNLVVLSHHLPSFRFCRDPSHRQSYIATNLEPMMRPPVQAWISGRYYKPSSQESEINCVHCRLNSYWHRQRKDNLMTPITTEYVEIPHSYL